MAAKKQESKKKSSLGPPFDLVFDPGSSVLIWAECLYVHMMSLLHAWLWHLMDGNASVRLYLSSTQTQIWLKSKTLILNKGCWVLATSKITLSTEQWHNDSPKAHCLFQDLLINRSQSLWSFTIHDATGYCLSFVFPLLSIRTLFVFYLSLFSG